MTVSEAQGRLPAERRARLLELLQQQKIARVHDLASDLAVSAITIRRDIALLAEEGLVRRVRGGAALVQDFSKGRVPTGPLLDHDLARRDEVAPATVGMVVPSLDYYWPDVIRGVREAAGAVGVRVVLRGATYQAADEQRQLTSLVESAGVDGLLVAPTIGSDEGDALVRWLQSAGVPVVLIERTATVGPLREAMESVVSDHALGAAMAVRHLAELGHRRVGVITTVGSPTAPHVHAGWRSACQEQGLVMEGTPEVQTVDRRDAGWARALDE
ncbi:DeoR family transcriptional regulator, partial [Microbispora sp. NPDC049125]|uniref:DeoR family transcriptional regulator n=1 Tax=Microbispora sp. NPDC049125 TaxID=3154929 RepID=UPI003465AA18